MKNVTLSILIFTLLVAAAAQPAEAASRKSKALVMHSDRSRDAFATMIPSTPAIRLDPYAASDMERFRNGAMSAPAGQ